MIYVFEVDGIGEYKIKISTGFMALTKKRVGLCHACVIRRMSDDLHVASVEEVGENETGFETGWEERLLDNCLVKMFSGDKEGKEKARAKIMNWLAETRKEKQ